MNAVVQRAKEMAEAIRVQQEEMAEELRAEFGTMFTDIFGDDERFRSIGWVQFTPYFNDGEPCEFSVDVDYLRVDYDGEGTEFEDIDWGYIEFGDVNLTLTGEGSKWNKRVPESVATAAQAVFEVIRSVPEGTMKDIFGDHAEVTISRDGIEVSEYYHD